MKFIITSAEGRAHRRYPWDTIFCYGKKWQDDSLVPIQFQAHTVEVTSVEQLFALIGRHGHDLVVSTEVHLDARQRPNSSVDKAVYPTIVIYDGYIE